MAGGSGKLCVPPQLAEPRAPITCVDDAGGSGRKPCAEPERKLGEIFVARTRVRVASVSRECEEIRFRVEISCGMYGNRPDRLAPISRALFS